MTNKKSLSSEVVTIMFPLIFVVVLFLLAGLLIVHMSGYNQDSESIDKLNFGIFNTIDSLPQNTSYICTSEVSVSELNCDGCSWWFESKTGECAYITKK